MTQVAFYELSSLSEDQRASLLTRPESDLEFFLEKVKPIIEDVRTKGDVALVEYAAKFDNAHFGISEVGASKAEIDAAYDQIDREMIETLEYAADNIRRFHEEQLPSEIWMKEIRPGVFAGERYSPIDSAAVYSPRGKGSFPSVTLMGAIPAVVAGVSDPIDPVTPSSLPIIRLIRALRLWIF